MVVFKLIERNYLNHGETALIKEFFDYLNQFCKNELTKENVQQLLTIIFQNNIAEFNITTNDYRTMLIQTIVISFVNLNEDNFTNFQYFIETIIRSFIRVNAQVRPAKLFEVFKYIFPKNIPRTHPQLFHELCSEINRQIEYLSQISYSGTQLIR